MDDVGERHAEDITAETLDAAGIGGDDRVVVALNSDGALVGARWAKAAASIAAAACAWGPRRAGGLRRVLAALEASVLITTPDLARRLIEGNERRPTDSTVVDHLVLTGHLRPTGLRRIADRLGSTAVHEVWCDPYFGMAVAARPLDAGPYAPVRPGLLSLAPLPSVRPSGAAVGEWAITPPWRPWDGTALRTGSVGRRRTDGRFEAPRWTIGDEILVRGRWLSLDQVAEAVRSHGVPSGCWSLIVGPSSAGDSVQLHVVASKVRSLHDLGEELNVALPVRLDVVATDGPGPLPELVDRRGHHLGRRDGARTPSRTLRP